MYRGAHKRHAIRVHLSCPGARNDTTPPPRSTDRAVAAWFRFSPAGTRQRLLPSRISERTHNTRCLFILLKSFAPFHTILNRDIDFIMQIRQRTHKRCFISLSPAANPVGTILCSAWKKSASQT